MRQASRLDVRRKVGRGGRCERGIRREPRLPDRALVAQESADPVASHAVAQHGVAVLACRDDIKLVLVDDGGKMYVGYRARMPVAGEGHNFGGLRHVRR